jgi:hypothetical protein
VLKLVTNLNQPVQTGRKDTRKEEEPKMLLIPILLVLWLALILLLAALCHMASRGDSALTEQHDRFVAEQQDHNFASRSPRDGLAA